MFFSQKNKTKHKKGDAVNHNTNSIVSVATKSAIHSIPSRIHNVVA